MIKEEKINGKIFVTQTTYYVYDSDEARNDDKPSIVTSDEIQFNKMKEIETKCKLMIEFEFYKKHQNELVEKYDGKYIVIVGEQIYDVYETVEEAYQTPQKDHKLGEFLIHLVGAGEDNYTQRFNSKVSF